MRNDKLAKWAPCQSYCQMTGAAAAILSLKDACVVFNGPRWCSVIAERELTSHNYDYMYRTYCSHIEQCDLLFGTEDKLNKVFEEIVQEGKKPSLVAVLTSCSIGLIGDDVEGIVKAQGLDCPTFAVDAGGLTGLYEEGYQLAFIKLLQGLNLQPCEPEPRRINLLGFNNTDPCNQGDVMELKRLLKLVGVEVGVCLGQEELTLDQLQELPKAALNVVLVEELSQQLAEYLKQELKQEYIIAPMPYGPKQTHGWLEAIGKALKIGLATKELDYEIYRLNEDVGQQLAMMKYRIPKLNYNGALIYMPYSKAIALAKALKEEQLQLPKIEIRIEGNYQRNQDREFAREKLPSDCYNILCGTVNDRIIEANYANTIYINCYKQEGLLKSPYRTYVGLRGWSELLSEIFKQTLTINFLKEEGEIHV